MKHIRNEKGFGMYEVIGIAAVLIVAAFVVIPGFRDFAEDILVRMDNWLESTVLMRLFPIS